jgi:flagellar motor switch protein FliN/FliY
MTQEEIDALMEGIDENTLDNISSADAAQQANTDGATAATPDMPDLSDQPTTTSGPADPKMDLLYDLSLPVSIELGRTQMLIRDVLKLGRGSVVEFDKLVSEPVDVLINGKKIAEGEVVVIDKHFGIRITTLVDSSTIGRRRT